MRHETIGYLKDMSKCRRTPTGWRFNSVEHFVLVHGRGFVRAALPKGCRLGPLGQCFRNSICLATSRRLLYVEGYARWRKDGYPFLHAWCADQDGNAYDPTWPDGMDYYGVTIDVPYAIERRKVSKWQSVLDSPPDFAVVSGQDNSWRLPPLSTPRLAIAV